MGKWAMGSGQCLVTMTWQWTISVVVVVVICCTATVSIANVHQHIVNAMQPQSSIAPYPGQNSIFKIRFSATRSESACALHEYAQRASSFSIVLRGRYTCFAGPLSFRRGEA